MAEALEGVDGLIKAAITFFVEGAAWFSKQNYPDFKSTTLIPGPGEEIPGLQHYPVGVPDWRPPEEVKEKKERKPRAKKEAAEPETQLTAAEIVNRAPVPVAAPMTEKQSLDMLFKECALYVQRDNIPANQLARQSHAKRYAKATYGVETVATLTHDQRLEFINWLAGQSSKPTA